MDTSVSNSHMSMDAQPAHDAMPRRLIVTAGVVVFAIRDWSLWVLLRDSPWGQPMRLVLGTESVTDAVDRTLEAVLIWPAEATLLQLKAGWQEQQVYVWGSTEQGAAVSLIHSVLLRAHHDELRPNLQSHSVPSLRAGWTAVMEIESGQRTLDPEVRPVLQTALDTLRSQVQRDPEIVLRYLAHMGEYHGLDRWMQDRVVGKETRPMNILKEPTAGDGI